MSSPLSLSIPPFYRIKAMPPSKDQREDCREIILEVSPSLCFAVRKLFPFRSCRHHNYGARKLWSGAPNLVIMKGYYCVRGILQNLLNILRFIRE
ncbi:hypothetical protein AVEN_251830-1 [Araneus ventricosus]|uniref:Uncharacterized protein n=1 Tax=Araneus ventricosus TaxID=182803 RepID=A0A4Y2MS16_ARAVE|nr:hypothetical protein AVEN_251830-1 [Araneus ventricosus]